MTKFLKRSNKIKGGAGKPIPMVTNGTKGTKRKSNNPSASKSKKTNKKISILDIKDKISELFRVGQKQSIPEKISFFTNKNRFTIDIINNLLDHKNIFETKPVFFLNVIEKLILLYLSDPEIKIKINTQKNKQIKKLLDMIQGIIKEKQEGIEVQKATLNQRSKSFGANTSAITKSPIQEKQNRNIIDQEGENEYLFFSTLSDERLRDLEKIDLYGKGDRGQSIIKKIIFKLKMYNNDKSITDDRKKLVQNLIKVFKKKLYVLLFNDKKIGNNIELDESLIPNTLDDLKNNHLIQNIDIEINNLMQLNPYPNNDDLDNYINNNLFFYFEKTGLNDKTKQQKKEQNIKNQTYFKNYVSINYNINLQESIDNKIQSQIIKKKKELLEFEKENLEIYAYKSFLRAIKYTEIYIGTLQIDSKFTHIILYDYPNCSFNIGTNKHLDLDTFIQNNCTNDLYFYIIFNTNFTTASLVPKKNDENKKSNIKVYNMNCNQSCEADDFALILTFLKLKEKNVKQTIIVKTDDNYNWFQDMINFKKSKEKCNTVYDAQTPSSSGAAAAYYDAQTPSRSGAAAAYYDPKYKPPSRSGAAAAYYDAQTPSRSGAAAAVVEQISSEEEDNNKGNPYRHPYRHPYDRNPTRFK